MNLNTETCNRCGEKNSERNTNCVFCGNNLVKNKRLSEHDIKGIATAGDDVLGGRPIERSAIKT